MAITQEELNQPVHSTQLIPMYSEEDHNVFAVLFRFPGGRDQVWAFKAPDVPVTDDGIRDMLSMLLESIIADLRDGRSEPLVKRCRECFHRTNWESVTGALQRLLVDWAKKRNEWARAIAAPIQIQ